MSVFNRNGPANEHVQSVKTEFLPSPLQRSLVCKTLSRSPPKAIVLSFSDSSRGHNRA